MDKALKPNPDAVRIEQIDGHWTVFVHEDGETLQTTFETEEWARNFATGQRLRLESLNAPKQ